MTQCKPNTTAIFNFINYMQHYSLRNYTSFNWERTTGLYRTGDTLRQLHTQGRMKTETYALSNPQGDLQLLVYYKVRYNALYRKYQPKNKRRKSLKIKIKERPSWIHSFTYPQMERVLQTCKKKSSLLVVYFQFTCLLSRANRANVTSTSVAGREGRHNL